MTLKTATGSAGTNGQVYSAATAGCSALVGSGVPTATNQNLLPGTSLNFLVNESTNLIGMSFTGTSDTTGAEEIYVYFFSLPGVACVILDARSASASAGRISISATNKFVVQNAAGTTINSFANAFTANTWYRLELLAAPGTTTSNGTINAAYYLGSSATAVESSTSGATVNAGTAPLVEYRGGKLSTNVAVNAQFALFGANNGSSSFIGTAVASAPANAAPTVTAGATVVMSSGSTANITASGNDTDGTISSFAATLASTSSSTTPTIGTPVVTGAGTANASVSIPISNLTPGDHQFNVTDTDNSGSTSSSGVCRILYTSLAPTRRSVTLSGVTMVSPTSGTALAALNNQASVPVTFTTAGPPAAGAGVTEVYQPYDANATPHFFQSWAASDTSTPITVYVDMKTTAGATVATVQATLTSTTPVPVGRDLISSEVTALGADRSALVVASRFS